MSINILATATVDTTFGAAGRAAISLGNSQRVSGFAVQNNDKIIVVGDVSNGDSNRDGVVVRYNANGTLDQSFGVGGKVVLSVTPQDDLVYGVAVQTDGKIVIVGSVMPSASSVNSDFLILRLNQNGSLDSGFGNGGIITVNQGTTDSLRAVKIQPDGKIVAVGGTSDLGGRGAVFRFNQNGTFDNSFGGGFVFIDRPVATNEIFHSLDFYSNNRILLGGEVTFGTGPGSRAGFVTLLEPNGTIVQDFGINGFLGTNLFSGASQTNVKVLTNGNIIIGGDSPSVFTNSGTYVTNLVQRNVSGFDLLSNGHLIMLSRPYSTPAITGIRIYNRNLQFVGSDERELSVNMFNGTDVNVQSNDKILILRDGEILRLIGVTSDATRQAYFDDDRKTDIAVYRPSNSTFYVTRTAFSQPPYSVTIPPSAQRQIIPERFSSLLGLGGIPRSDLGWFNYATNETPGLFGVREQARFYWGAVGDVPVGGDYDGDGLTDYTVFRPSNGTWYISQSSNSQFRAVRFGQAGDKLVPADYDYDGITDFAVFRPSNGTWYISRSSDGGFYGIQFGANGDVPLTGDYDGDGRADFTVFRPSNGVWYSLKSLEGFSAVAFGISTDQPVPGDYDGDGRHDIAVFRAGNWYLLQSSEGFRAVQWGQAGDVPVTVRY